MALTLHTCLARQGEQMWQRSASMVSVIDLAGVIMV